MKMDGDEPGYEDGNGDADGMVIPKNEDGNNNGNGDADGWG